MMTEQQKTRASNWQKMNAERIRRRNALLTELMVDSEPTDEQISSINKALKRIVRRLAQTTEGG